MFAGHVVEQLVASLSVVLPVGVVDHGQVVACSFPPSGTHR